MYTASADKTVRVWDLNSKRCVQARRELGCRGGGGCCCRGGDRLAADAAVARDAWPDALLCPQLLPPLPADRACARRARAHTPQVLESHTRPVLSLAICGNRLFSGSYDYSIRVWNLDTLQVCRGW